MAREIKEALLYDFNYHLFVANTMLPNVRNVEDRQNVIKWLKMFKTSAKTLQEMKLRNEFMSHLVRGVQSGVVPTPFNSPPPHIPLTTMISILPEDPLDDTQECVGRKIPELMRRSPDAGEFLAAQPIPDVGAFCYVAVLTKKKRDDSQM